MHLLVWHWFVFLTTLSCLGSGERANAVTEGSSAKFHKIIQKKVVMDYFLCKVADVQQEISN